MTIAIALQARDGLVVAADSQESGDYLKGSKGKIACYYAHDAGWAETCIISGAGDSGYVQALTDKLGETYISADPKAPLTSSLGKGYPKGSLQSEFRDCIKQFYKDHIIPFAGYPEKKRPDVEMLIACQRKTAMGIFSSEKTVVNYAMAYRAIGWGSTFAELFLGKLWEFLPVEQAEILAAYIIFLSKGSVETCGRFTSIATIRGAEIVDDGKSGSRLVPTREGSFVDGRKIEEWERSFRKKWWKAEKEKILSLVEEQAKETVLPKPSTGRKLAGRR